MSRMADYALWLEDTGRADGPEAQRAYMAHVLTGPPKQPEEPCACGTCRAAPRE